MKTEEGLGPQLRGEGQLNPQTPKPDPTRDGHHYGRSGSAGRRSGKPLGTRQVGGTISAAARRCPYPESQGPRRGRAGRESSRRQSPQDTGEQAAGRGCPQLSPASGGPWEGHGQVEAGSGPEAHRQRAVSSPSCPSSGPTRWPPTPGCHSELALSQPPLRQSCSRLSTPAGRANALRWRGLFLGWCRQRSVPWVCTGGFWSVPPGLTSLVSSATVSRGFWAVAGS